MGQAADGISNVSANEIQKEAGNVSRVYQSPVDWRIGQAIRNHVFWLITIWCAANFLAIGTVAAHQAAYLKDIGFSPMVAATALALVPGMSIFGRLAFGLLGVRFEVRLLAVVCFVVQAIALFILLSARSLFLIYIYSALFGVSYGALVTALPTFIGAYYGRLHYTQILGLMFPLAIIAQALGPVMAGAINDAMGTYFPAFAIITGFSVVGLVCAVLASPPRHPDLVR